ncbi:M23 family metallopeptidase [bacterium]|nr:M23 family metallopeptidase [bacterium]MCI7794670.1 M23 family metallopeptidase [bacterium]
MRLSNGEVLLAWPLASHIITAGWTYNDGGAHNAIDLRAALKTPVYAAEDGTVTQTQLWDGVTKTGMQSYGVMCRVKHADYKGGELCTRYAHLTELCVRRGETVREGQLIGYSGATGDCYGAHLHFEVIYRGVRCNPLNWLDADFTVKDAAVGTHLGSYTSVERPAADKPAARMQRITIGPVSAGDAMTIYKQAQTLGLVDAGLYSAEYIAG